MPDLGGHYQVARRSASAYSSSGTRTPALRLSHSRLVPRIEP